VVPETELPHEIRRSGHRLADLAVAVEHAADDAITQAMTVLITNPGAGAARIERFSVLVDRTPVGGMSCIFRPTPLKSCAV
jgi:hypothetical protein